MSDLDPNYNFKVRTCCEKSIPYGYLYEIRRDGSIDIAFDDSHYDIEGVSFCPFCGKKLEKQE